MSQGTPLLFIHVAPLSSKRPTDTWAGSPAGTDPAAETASSSVAVGSPGSPGSAEQAATAAHAERATAITAARFVTFLMTRLYTGPPRGRGRIDVGSIFRG